MYICVWGKLMEDKDYFSKVCAEPSERDFLSPVIMIVFPPPEVGEGKGKTFAMGNYVLLLDM